MSHYPHLLNPLPVAGVTLPNRTVMGAMHTRLETLDRPQERLAAFYAARAKGERPWLMDPKDFLSIRLTNETMSAKSSLQMDLEDRMMLNPNGPVRTQPMSIAELEELVGNPQKPDHKNLYTTQQIKKLLKLSGESVPNTAQLKHALKRISENWTGHRKPVKICPRNAEYVYKEGEVWYKDRRAWLLPAWRTSDDD